MVFNIRNTNNRNHSFTLQQDTVRAAINVVIAHFTEVYITRNLGGITRKGPLWPESLSYQKKDGRVTCSSFFWYDTEWTKQKKNQI